MINLFILLLIFSGTINFLFASSKYYGEIADIKGSVWLIEDSKATPAQEGMPVRARDKIKTGSNSSCNIKLDDGTLIHVSANTQTSFESIEISEEGNLSQIKLWIGKLMTSVLKRKKNKFTIRTPITVIAVRGTELAVESTDEKTHIGVFEGEVAVSGIDSPEEVIVKSDEETTVAKNERPTRPIKLQMVMLKNKERMEELRGKIQELRERLKRVPPEERQRLREEALQRFIAIRQKRQEQFEKLRNRNERLRNRRAR